MVCRGAQCSADDGDRREERNSTDATTKWDHSARDPRRVLGTRAYQRVWQAGGVWTHWLSPRSEFEGL